MKHEQRLTFAWFIISRLITMIMHIQTCPFLKQWHRRLLANVMYWKMFHITFLRCFNASFFYCFTILKWRLFYKYVPWKEQNILVYMIVKGSFTWISKRTDTRLCNIWIYLKESRRVFLCNPLKNRAFGQPNLHFPE